MAEYIVTEHPDFPYEEPKPQELIRCRDCKWHEWYIRSRLMDGREYESNECRKFNMAVTPDYYCADGERRQECGE